MKANQATFPVRVMSRLLGVSASGFYAWLQRPLSARAVADIGLTALIHAIHRRSNGAYGAPSIHAELADDHDRRVGKKRVARLMRAANLRGLHPRRFVTTTIGDPVADRALDHVDRHFAAEGPDRLWVADITYIPTWAGFLYLAVVLDVWSRRIVGWAIEPHLKTELVLSALHGPDATAPWASFIIRIAVVRVDSNGRRNTSTVKSWEHRTPPRAGRLRCGRRVVPRIGVGSGRRSPAGWRRGGAGGRRPAGHEMVPRKWRHAADQPGPSVGALPVVCRTRRDRHLARPALRGS